MVASLSLFFQFFRSAGACGVASATHKQFCFPTWACAAGFNNNNNQCSVSLSYFNLTLPMYKCLGEHGCVSFTFSIAILHEWNSCSLGIGFVLDGARVLLN